MALMGSVYSIEYPPEFVEFEKSWTGWLGLNVMTEIECYQKISFLMKLRIAVLSPVAMIVMIFMVSYISMLTTRKPEKKKERRDAGLSAFITVTFIVLPSVSLTVFQSFSCDDETNTLNADPLVICDSSNDDYKAIKMLGLLGFLLYPFGIPFIYLRMLGSHYGPSVQELKERIVHILTGRAQTELKKDADMRRRGASSVEAVEELVISDMAKEKEEQMRLFNLENTAPKYLATLCAEFEPQCWWAPVLEQYTKLAITSFTILLGRGQLDQIILGMLVNIISLCVQFSTQPFKDFNDDMFSMFCHVQVFLVLLWSLLVKFQQLLEVEHYKLVEHLGAVAEEYVPSTTLLKTSTLGWLLICSNVSVVFVFSCLMILEFKIARKTVKVRKKWDSIKKRAASMGLADEEVMEELGVELGAFDRASILEKFRAEKEKEKEKTVKGGGMSKKKKGAAAKANMAKARASQQWSAGENDEDEDGEIEMLENPIGNKAAKGGVGGERPFGGFGKHESVRHVSGADAVDLGSAEVAVSKHKKYATRAKEAMEGNEGKEGGLAPHVARANAFNNMPTKVNSNGLLDFTKKAQSKPKKKTSGGGGKLPPPQYDSDDDFAPPPPTNKLWDTHHSEEHDADYYVHRESGETVWERPPGV